MYHTYYSKEEFAAKQAAERRRIGYQISEARKAAGLTQAKLSEMTGMNRTDISKIENGSRNVSIDTLTTIAHALGCSIWMLRRDMAKNANYDQLYVEHIMEKGKVLTMGDARRLAGKKIAYTFHGYYMNEPYVEEVVIGKEVIKEERFMSPLTYYLTAPDGDNLYLFADSTDDNAVVNCGDWGNEVHFIEL